MFIGYPKCSTCKRAEKWLKDNNIIYTYRNIKEKNPSYLELKEFVELSDIPIKKFFNTSGIVYRELGLKEKLDTMTEEEKLKILSSDGMLVKRPILVAGSMILVGFKENEWEEKLKR